MYMRSFIVYNHMHTYVYAFVHPLLSAIPPARVCICTNKFLCVHIYMCKYSNPLCAYLYVYIFKCAYIHVCTYVYAFFNPLLSLFFPACVYISLYIHTFTYLRVYISMHVYIYLCTHSSAYIFMCVRMNMYSIILSYQQICLYVYTYGVATSSRLLKIIGLFCRIWSLL